MTQRAAITVARRNLLEVLKGVRIDSSTTVENFIVTNDVIKTQVSGFLQGSQVMQTKYFSDGSVEVTVGVRVTGELASLLMPPSLFLLTPSPPTTSAQAKAPKAAAGAPSALKEQAAPPDKVAPKEATAVGAKVPSGSTTEKERGKGEVPPKVEPLAPATAEGQKGESPGRKVEIAVPPAQAKPPEGTTLALPSSAPSRAEASKPPPLPVVEKAEEKGPTASEEKVGSEAKPAPPPVPLPVIATGLVVDARGLGLKPALLPRILDEGGAEIYSTRQVSRQNAVEQGLVGYAKDVSAAQRNIRVTDKPLLIKGIKAVGKEKTDVVIPDPEAAVVVAAASASNFLEKSRVIIVYD
jgi:hypothetical protein